MAKIAAGTDDKVGFKLPGTIVPPLTPFTQNGDVDYDLLEGIVDYVVDDCDASMVIVAGVEAQEYQFLTFEARKELIEKTIGFVAGRKPCVVGISHPSIKIAAELGQFAQDKGAEALQLLAPLRPTGGPATTGELVAYFKAVLAETELPMMLYINSGPGADVSVPQTIELAKLDRIDYVKESSRDLARVSRLIAEVEKAGHAKYFTTMQMWLATLTLGGTGVTLPPPAALLARRIADAAVSGDYDEASRLQEQVSIWPARWMEAGLAAVMKASLNHLGVPSGDPYPPYQPLAGEALKSLKAHLDTMDLPKKGKMKPMLDIKRLSLAEAQVLVEGATQKSQAMNTPMCIAVTDESGHLLAFDRMDGGKITSISIAIDKAFTGACARKGTHVYNQLCQPGQPTFGIHITNGGHFSIIGGGLPVIVDGEIVGGIGISSGTAIEDQEVAEAALAYFYDKNGYKA